MRPASDQTLTLDRLDNACQGEIKAKCRGMEGEGRGGLGREGGKGEGGT